MVILKNTIVFKRLISFGVMIAVSLVGTSHALSDGPIRLIPPPIEADEEGGYESQPTYDLSDEEIQSQENIQKDLGRGTVSGIAVQELNSDALGAIGVYGLDEGGLAANIWRGVPGERAVEMIGDVPTIYRNSSLGDLAYRLMASLAFAPDMLDRSKDQEGFDLARMAWLLERKRFGDVEQMHQQLKRNNLSTASVNLWAQSKLRSGDIGPLCSSEDRANRITETLWQRIDIICLYDQGLAEEAAFALDLYREFAASDDNFVPVIDHLLRSAGADKMTLVSKAGGDFAPLEYLAQTGRIATKTTDDKARLNWSDFPLPEGTSLDDYAQALEGMEQAFIEGEISGVELRHVYLSVPLTNGLIAQILDGVASPSGALGRAQYMSVMEEHLTFLPEGVARDLSRLELLERIVINARSTDDLDIVARLFGPELVNLPVSGALLQQAQWFLPLLWSAGYQQKAEGWVSRLSLEALVNPDIRLFFMEHWPTLLILGREGLVDPSIVNADIYYHYLMGEEGLQSSLLDGSATLPATGLTESQSVNEVQAPTFADRPLFSGPIPERLILVAGLLKAFGKMPDHAAFHAALERAEKQYMVSTASNPVVQLYERDLAQDNGGPMLARALMLLGEASGRDMPPHLLQKILIGLLAYDSGLVAQSVALDRLNLN